MSVYVSTSSLREDIQFQEEQAIPLCPIQVRIALSGLSHKLRTIPPHISQRQTVVKVLSSVSSLSHHPQLAQRFKTTQYRHQLTITYNIFKCSCEEIHSLFSASAIGEWPHPYY